MQLKSEYRPDWLQVWSCGGGTQSAAIGVLIVQGQIKAPDIAIIVDTGRERQSTWDYFYDVLGPRLSQVGVDILVVSKAKYATKDLWGGEDGKTLLLPAFTDQSGSISKLSGFCSAEWKRDVAKRFLRQVKRVKQCQNWIGYSIDEMRRIRAPREAWCQLRHPLIFDVPLNRHDCRELVLGAGWPEPPRSSCWLCPNHSDAEWLDMKLNQPGDFQKAIAEESAFQQIDPHAFLHKSCRPLESVDLDPSNDQSDLGGCAHGMCFV